MSAAVWTLHEVIDLAGAVLAPHAWSGLGILDMAFATAPIAPIAVIPLVVILWPVVPITLGVCFIHLVPPGASSTLLPFVYSIQDTQPFVVHRP